MKSLTLLVVCSLILGSCSKSGAEQCPLVSKIKLTIIIKDNRISKSQPTKPETVDFKKTPNKTSAGGFSEVCDAYDRDNDGLYLCDDPDCASFSLCNPGKGKWEWEIDCKDGIDNDQDGATDMEDADCKYKKWSL